MIHLGDHLAEVACQAYPWREVSSLGLLDTAGCHAQLQYSFHSPAESYGGSHLLLLRTLQPAAAKSAVKTSCEPPKVVRRPE